MNFWEARPELLLTLWESCTITHVTEMNTMVTTGWRDAINAVNIVCEGEYIRQGGE